MYNTLIWHTFIQPQAKLKPSFLEYSFLTTFLTKRGIKGKKIWFLSNLVHFYTILDTVMRSWTLPYELHTNVSINVPASIKACPLNVFKLFIRRQIYSKKINRKQCWNMWILQYLLKFSPQVTYQHILKRLNKALFW